MEKIIKIKNNKVFVKNSSADINFGNYKTIVKICTDGGRLYIDREYFANFEVDDKKNLLKIIIREK